MPHRAVDDDQIEPAVVVVVDEAGAEAGEAEREQRRASTVRSSNRPLPTFAIERVAFVVEVGDEQILVAVAVDVARVDAHAALRLPDAVDRPRRPAAPRR